MLVAYDGVPVRVVASGRNPPDLDSVQRRWAMSLSAVLAGLLVEAATTTAIDVITKRTVDPKVRFAGRTWKALSLADKVYDVQEAIRISAYSDAAGIIAGEIVVQKASRSVLSSIPEIDVMNFRLIEHAEGLVADPDFANHFVHDPSVLDPTRGQSDFVSEDYESYGGALFDMVETCLLGARDAHRTVNDLLSNAECNVPRQTPALGWTPTWIDKINTGLGYALWLPTPVIGVGSGYAAYGEYVGTYRRDDAEGYGKIKLRSGGTYFGQVRQGTPHGYGITKYPDGRVFAGYNTPHDRDLGVVVSANRDKAVIGASTRGIPKGYGRQIGLKNGVGSVSGFWYDGELSTEIPTQGGVHRDQYESYKSSSLAHLMGDEYQKFVDELRERAELHGGAEDKIDARFLRLIGHL